MKLYVKVLIGIVVLLVLLVAVGVAASMYTNQQDRHTNPIVTLTPHPTATYDPTASPTTTPKPTANPTITPHPTIASTPTPSNVAIWWTYQTASYVVDKYTIAMPNSGNMFVLVNMTITNNGYSDGFSTNPSYFSLISNNVQYSIDSETYSLGSWVTVNVLTRGTYSGTIVFQVPLTASSFEMNYKRQFTNFNIIWTKWAPW